jgi:hypothetical protein
MQQHYHAPTNTIGPLPKRDGNVTDFDRASPETHRAHGYYPVAETVYVEADAPGVAYDYATGIATVTRVVAKPAEPTPEEVEHAARVEGLRDAYRQSTRAICSLAGMEPVDKLEDTAFIDARGAAMQADFVTTSVLCDNLTYALFQLYRLDGDDAWSKI